jgi:hypothetical protein
MIGSIRRSLRGWRDAAFYAGILAEMAYVAFVCVMGFIACLIAGIGALQ